MLRHSVPLLVRKAVCVHVTTGIGRGQCFGRRHRTRRNLASGELFHQGPLPLFRIVSAGGSKRVQLCT